MSQQHSKREMEGQHSSTGPSFAALESEELLLPHFSRLEDRLGHLGSRLEKRICSEVSWLKESMAGLTSEVAELKMVLRMLVSHLRDLEPERRGSTGPQAAEAAKQVVSMPISLQHNHIEPGQRDEAAGQSASPPRKRPRGDLAAEDGREAEPNGAAPLPPPSLPCSHDGGEEPQAAAEAAPGRDQPEAAAVGPQRPDRPEEPPAPADSPKSSGISADRGEPKSFLAEAAAALDAGEHPHTPAGPSHAQHQLTPGAREHRPPLSSPGYFPAPLYGYHHGEAAGRAEAKPRPSERSTTDKRIRSLEERFPELKQWEPRLTPDNFTRFADKLGRQRFRRVCRCKQSHCNDYGRIMRKELHISDYNSEEDEDTYEQLDELLRNGANVALEGADKLLKKLIRNRDTRGRPNPERIPEKHRHRDLAQEQADLEKRRHAAS